MATKPFVLMFCYFLYRLAKEQTTDKQNNQPAILSTATQEIITKDHIVKATNRSQTQSKLLRITNLVKK